MAMRDATLLIASVIAVCHGRRLVPSSGQVQDDPGWSRATEKILTAKKPAAAFKPVGLGADYSSHIGLRRARAARIARSSMMATDVATKDAGESNDYLSSEERASLTNLQLIIDQIQALPPDEEMASVQKDMMEVAQKKLVELRKKELEGATHALNAYLQSDSQNTPPTAFLSKSEKDKIEELEDMFKAFTARDAEEGLNADESALFQKVCENLFEMKGMQLSQLKESSLDEMENRALQLHSEVAEKMSISSPSVNFGELVEADKSFMPSRSELSTKAQAWGVDATSTDVVLGCSIFLLAHLVCCWAASAAGYGLTLAGDESTGAAAAICRLMSTFIFLLFDSRLSVVPLSDWLLKDTSKQSSAEDDESDQPTMPPLPLAAPLAAACMFIPYILLVYGIGEATGVDILPKAREWPNPGRAFDILLAAPLTEEIFFRAWLLTNMKKAGLSDGLGLAVQAILWTLWHGNQGSFFNYILVSLGFATVYQRSGGSLPLTVGTHSIYNLYVLLFRASRVS